MNKRERERAALERLVAAGAPGAQARELAPDLAELAISLRRARERLSWEQEPAVIHEPDRR